jgi:hypothetical protein
MWLRSGMGGPTAYTSHGALASTGARLVAVAGVAAYAGGMSASNDRARAAAVSALLLSASLLVGCGTIVPNDQAHEAAADRNVQQRVPFDLGCKDPQLVRLGDVAHLGTYMTRMNIGVICGDKKATYVVTCVSNWGNITCTPELNTAAK